MTLEKCERDIEFLRQRIVTLEKLWEAQLASKAAWDRVLSKNRKEADASTS